MGITIEGTFETRQAVELAVEHLVQEYGIERTDIFIEPVSAVNTAGLERSGGDADSADDPKQGSDAALNGTLLVSVDVNEDEQDAVAKAFADAGALNVSAH
jgi:hypothetical protein